MKPNILDRLQDHRAELETEEESIHAAATERGEFTAEERERLDTILAESQTLDGDIARARGRTERIRQAPAGATEGPLTPVGEYPNTVDFRSISDRFLESDGWKAYKGNVAPGGKFSKNTRIESPAIEFGELLPRRGGVKGLVTGGSGTSGGAFSIPSQTGIYDTGTFERELTILDVVTRGTTDSDSVEYVRLTGYTNAAAPVAEADSIDPEDLTGLKPQSAMTFERVLEAVKTIAHWEAATTRALEDGGQLRTIMNDLLLYGLREEVEDQIVSGSGSGEDFKGILDYSGDGLQELADQGGILETARRARTLVRVVGRGRANAYLMNPYDAELYDLEMTLGGPGSNFQAATEGTNSRLWRLPIVESEAVPQGTALCGDFRKAIFWDRLAASIRASDGVNNFFLKNMVAILAELRAAFGVIRPQAFVAFDVAGSGS
jgi:HK97 family phage major capsid protein